MAGTAKTCAVYFKDGACYVNAEVITNHGTVAKEPMVKLPGGVSALELGQTVLDALEAYEDTDGLPEPDHLEKFLRFVGARSWRGFTKGNLHINVGYDGKQVRLIPSRADGKGAFLYDNEPVLCAPEPESLGRKMLELAESY